MEEKDKRPKRFVVDADWQYRKLVEWGILKPHDKKDKGEANETTEE